jgi:hypothetical protein
LADRRAYVLGRELVIEAQDDARLDPEFCLVAVVRNQYWALAFARDQDGVLMLAGWGACAEPRMDRAGRGER